MSAVMACSAWNYPVMKFLDGQGQWWHINAVFNEPSKKTAWCKISRMRWPREKFVVTICNMSDPVLWKNMIEKHLYIHVKMGGSSIQL
jgi:hypothetical protein